ncbi:hypothetical protein C8R45DRAFT_1101674 [Mycena sanguinolenta]|nr:hypothetical protein C8R45DRAFT_1101674 [Mycena sanguinolenta]
MALKMLMNLMKAEDTAIVPLPKHARLSVSWSSPGAFLVLTERDNAQVGPKLIIKRQTIVLETWLCSAGGIRDGMGLNSGVHHILA